MKKLLPTGSLLNGKYKILKQLSSRALGNLYLANDTKFRENVLIKELFVQNISKRKEGGMEILIDESCQEIYNEYLDRFNEEARALRQISNGHIAKVTDLFSENNTSYYVMENVEGELLSQRMMRKNKPFAEAEVISYLTQMLDGLNAMHSQGFWHLDITPSSIVVDDNGHIKFLEYGHCKLVDNESTIVADTNHDPMELQALDENNIGPWTDYYSLGATLYNLLTGKRPPAAAEVNEATTNLYHFPTSVSKKMQRFVLWLMTPNIFRRPQDSNEINDFLFGITGSATTDKSFEKSMGVAVAGSKKHKTKSSIKQTSNDDDDDDDDDGDDDD
ncbi:MAG: serine/threonine protein kinase, partial [Bacteroidaceae bacterium]|nr:serine/threonine protein kinase [Bacteroidaceae bacterium]